MNKPKIIGIGGVSQSGKSTLTSLLRKSFSGKTLTISQDDFVNPKNQIPKINDLIDWEHPKSVDFNEIIEKIHISKSSYDLIIVEGLLAFYDSKLTNLYDFKITMNISKDIFLSRRSQEKRWGSEPSWYLEHVWSSFLEFGQYDSPDLKIDGHNPISTTMVESIFAELSKNPQ